MKENIVTFEIQIDGLKDKKGGVGGLNFMGSQEFS